MLRSFDFLPIEFPQCHCWSGERWQTSANAIKETDTQRSSHSEANYGLVYINKCNCGSHPGMFAIWAFHIHKHFSHWTEPLCSLKTHYRGVRECVCGSHSCITLVLMCSTRGYKSKDVSLENWPQLQRWLFQTLAVLPTTSTIYI